MSWLVIPAAVALVSGVLSWWIVRRFGRTSILLWLATPCLTYLLVGFATAAIASEIATCNAPDCGPSIFAASILIAAVLAIAGFVGSVAGVWWAVRAINRG